MSLALDVDQINYVLLADGWHEVGQFNDGSLSFSIDAYEFIWGEDVAFGGGESSLICSSGFSFVEAYTKQQISGPLTSVLAVKQKV